MKDEVKRQARQQADQIFQKLDLDNNGSIDKEELRRVMTEDPTCQPLPPQCCENMTQEQVIEKFFAEADTNKDGVVTKDELMDFMDRMIDQMFDAMAQM